MPDRFVRRLNGPRGSVLLFLGLFVCLPHAVGTSPLVNPPGPIPNGLVAMSQVVPLYVYGAAWAVAGLLCLGGAFTGRVTREHPPLDRWAWGATAGLFVVWSFAYGAPWLLTWAGLLPTTTPDAALNLRAWVFACIYLGVALIWAVCARALPGRHADRRASIGTRWARR